MLIFRGVTLKTVRMKPTSTWVWIHWFLWFLFVLEYTALYNCILWLYVKTEGPPSVERKSSWRNPGEIVFIEIETNGLTLKIGRGPKGSFICQALIFGGLVSEMVGLLRDRLLTEVDWLPSFVKWVEGWRFVSTCGVFFILVYLQPYLKTTSMETYQPFPQFMNL